jgi:hypothetical protein
MDYEKRHDCEFEECECGKGEFHEIKRILRKNIGRVVTVFTESCGMAGEGFTGLVTKVDDGVVKFVTSIPSAPYENFRGRRCAEDCDYKMCEHCRNSHFGSAVIIPICKILAVSVVEI